MSRTKVGIYAGSFDPIHIGHVTFALQAIEEGKLDVVYFMPERTPANKHIQEHFGHRVAMIKQAIKPHRRLRILELDDKHFTVSKTLPKLNKRFKSQQLVFLFGSDKVTQINSWPNSDKLLSCSGLVIGLRQGDDLSQVQQMISSWPLKSLSIIPSYAPSVTSSKIRIALQGSQAAEGLLRSVAKYIRKNWLYISLANDSPDVFS